MARRIRIRILQEEQEFKVEEQEEELESGETSSGSLIEHQTRAVARRTLLLYLCRQYLANEFPNKMGSTGFSNWNWSDLILNLVIRMIRLNMVILVNLVNLVNLLI